MKALLRRHKGAVHCLLVAICLADRQQKERLLYTYSVVAFGLALSL
jgi:hypothetical protein